MKLRNHKEKQTQINTVITFSSIEELSEQLIEVCMDVFESAYSKDCMTNGELSTVHLLKALIKMHKFNNDIEKFIPDAEYLSVFEEMLINYEAMEKMQTGEDQTYD